MDCILFFYVRLAARISLTHGTKTRYREPEKQVNKQFCPIIKISVDKMSYTNNNQNESKSVRGD
jgi:hypothetical protein